MPYRKKPLAKAPSRKYLSAASFALGPGPEGAGQDVEREGHQSRAPRKMTRRSVAGGHQHHADRREQEQRVVLAGLHARARGR